MRTILLLAAVAVELMTFAADGILGKVPDVRILKGDSRTAFRDPAIYFESGVYHLFFTWARADLASCAIGYMTSRNLVNWTSPREITVRDQKLNYSSPGNLVRVGDEYILCFQTYPTPGLKPYEVRWADDTARLFTMRTRDFKTWSAPELLRVKGPDVPVEKMGRMIDAYLVRDRDGLWHCSYKQNGVSFSVSKDLKTWTYCGRTDGGENACILPTDDGGWMMFHSPVNGIGIKTSRDLKDWRDVKTLTFGQTDWPWAHGRLTAGTVLDARKIPGVGKYLMFFHASGPNTEREGDNWCSASLCIAWSDDLLEWDWPGRTKRYVTASDFGYDPLNATKCLQRAIDSGADTVFVDALKGEWCIEPISLRSNLELVFGRNVTVRAVPDAYANIYAMMFRGNNVTNVTIRGERGASVSMLKRDYLDATRYKWSEWRHLFAFYDSGRIALSNLTFSASGGDGIYLARCKDIRIDRVNALGHNRQGISIIGAENLYISRSTFDCTAGTPPACGIDFEPNKATECFVNCLVEDCDFNHNDSCGVCFHLPHFNALTRPVGVTIRNCRFIGNKSWGFRLYGSWSDPGVAGLVSVANCLFAANGGGGCSLAALPSDSLKVAFRNCTFDQRGIAGSALVFDNGENPFDFGGASFENTKIYADTADVFEFLGYTGDGVTNVQGVVDVHLPSGDVRRLSMEKIMAKYPPDPAARAFKPTPVYRKELGPVSPDAVCAARPLYCRGRQYFIQSAPTPGERKLKFLFKQYGANPYRPDVTIHDKVGTLVGKLKLEKDETDYVLKTTVPDNLHTFTINTHGNLCAVASASPGHGVLADSRLQVADAAGRRLYFVVPAASREVNAEILVRNGADLTMKMLDAAGSARAQIRKANAGRILTVERAPTATDEIWCLAVESMNRPFELRLGGGIIAVLSDAPEACMRYVK